MGQQCSRPHSHLSQSLLYPHALGCLAYDHTPYMQVGLHHQQWHIGWLMDVPGKDPMEVLVEVPWGIGHNPMAERVQR